MLVLMKNIVEKSGTHTLQFSGVIYHPRQYFDID